MSKTSSTKRLETIKTPESADKNHTQTALIKAAIKVFGRDGYTAASTRAIADEAGVNQALINYHFKTKHGLYLAVFDYINAFVNAGVGTHLVKIETALNSEMSIDKHFCWQSITQLLGTMLHMINSTDTTEWSSLIIHEQQHPTEAFAIIEHGAHGQMRNVLTHLVARLLNLASDSSEAKLVTLTLMGQILMFKIARATVLACMQWNSIEEEELTQIKRILFRNFAAILDCQELNQI